MWELIGVLILGVIAGSPLGWLAHSFRQWHRRVMLHMQMLFPVFRLAWKAALGVIVVGFLLYGWMVY